MNSGWRQGQEWPLEGTEWTRFYLHSAGRANSLNGDGRLTRDTPGSEPPDVFLYSPLNPTPTGGADGIYDQRPVETRYDVLVYSTPPLSEPLEVTGPVTMVLHAASTAPDTDFTAKAGRRRARRLRGQSVRWHNQGALPQLAGAAELMQPGETYQFTIDLNATGNLFLAGHQIRLEIASSQFPQVRSQSKHRRADCAGAPGPAATQTVFHDSKYQSYVILPVIPRKGSR